MSAGSAKCRGCGADVHWLHGQSPGTLCPGCIRAAVAAADAPKPDELTVDDVLGVLARHQKHVYLGADWHIQIEHSQWLLTHGETRGAALAGTFADCWAEAKRRGLLG